MIEILFCLVVGITDGDTIKARCGEPGAYQEVKVRLIAIDAPERGQDFGQRSKEALNDICYKQEAQITVYYTDRYGRKVAEVVCGLINANAYQVVNGYAWVYPRYAKDHEYLYQLQDIAQEKKLNIWSQPNPVPPWEWRKR